MIEENITALSSTCRPSSTVKTILKPIIPQDKYREKEDDEVLDLTGSCDSTLDRQRNRIFPTSYFMNTTT